MTIISGIVSFAVIAWFINNFFNGLNSEFKA